MPADFTLLNPFTEIEPGNDEREGRRSTAELLGQASKVSSAMSMGPPAEGCCHGDGTTWFAS